MIKCRRDFFSIILTTILCYVGMEEVCLSYTPKTPSITIDAIAAGTGTTVGTIAAGKDTTFLTGKIKITPTDYFRNPDIYSLTAEEIKLFQQSFLDREDVKTLQLYISLEDYYANKDLIKDCVYFSKNGFLGMADWDEEKHTGCKYQNNDTTPTLYHWYKDTLTELQGVSFLRESTINICEDRLEEEQQQYFVSRCGDKTIGINLLKGFSGYNNERICNFYDYSSDAKNVNMTNLRNFFAGTAITYTNQANKKQTIYGADVTNCLRTFLTLHCNPFNNNTKPKCLSKCPKDGVTDDVSYYTYQMFRGNTDFPSIIKWNVKTIADCGVTDFQDDAGYYFFGTDEHHKDLVKYSNTDYPGNRFYY